MSKFLKGLSAICAGSLTVCNVIGCISITASAESEWYNNVLVSAITDSEIPSETAMQIQNRYGYAVDEWTSDGEDHEIASSLFVGETYILHEESSASAEDIFFTLNADGTVCILESPTSDITVHVYMDGIVSYFFPGDAGSIVEHVYAVYHGDSQVGAFTITDAISGGYDLRIPEEEKNDVFTIRNAFSDGYASQAYAVTDVIARAGDAHNVSLQMEQPALDSVTVKIYANPGDTCRVYLSSKGYDACLAYYQSITGKQTVDLTDTVYGLPECAEVTVNDSGYQEIELVYGSYTIENLTTGQTWLTSINGTTVNWSDVKDQLLGDINLDGRVDITDAVLLNKAASGTVKLNAQAMQNADCDGDGTLNTGDSLSLLKFLVHLIMALPEVS